MLAKVTSGATVGLDSIPVTVEVDISERGLPSFTIVGLPNKAVEESKERVRAAIKNSGADFPTHRITVNLAPADLPKEGPAYDLPIALGLLMASGQIKADLKDALVLGELSLDGSLRHTNGILPMVLLAKEKKKKKIFLPETDAKEAAIIEGIEIYPLKSLLALFNHLDGVEEITPQKHIGFESLAADFEAEFDMSEIKGQEHVKRALEIAAAGGHNVFMKGVPGAGKTMLARALPGILPDLTEEEALEVTKIYSITGNLPPGASVITQRPFCAPHHTTSRIGLIGGGTRPMPGEISLAHRGVLFLDEFPEFPRHVLEALRQPMEDGIIQISRAAGTVKYPAKFILIAAANPCPQGYTLLRN
ncbi:YifB family Mg chelatase-like AAA ATPase [Patescibacteria group bacterium]|nr:YifB family Mg chelatase-like AAA ATPase [Patescibacteria group bacterium]